ncbi:N-acetylmuramoyl-L-alanine amidase [Actinomadura madurae]|uniref:N-acetylmuramoyl-L-alanine amidase n=1 Tax=Actinomadura madurae TaxID=1993 RepID=A0A1I5VDL2_9ACTN|nr:N-acetylmuramoyl-L-alanine amidase [Actinomadura madurae]SPT60571.1 N-acetylmuramoyl-L-alanine amidase AmiA precursor [Actinomadura madurae]
MRRFACASVIAGLALSLLAACTGSSDDGPPAGSAPPPTATGGGTPTTGSALSGKVIVLDPGHNGGNAEHPEEINRKVFVGNGYKPCNTTGTRTTGGYPEHAFTWDLANRLAKVLRDGGAKVTLTRKNDTGVGPCITERAAIANRLDADATLSIHADGSAPSGHGFHVITPLPVGRNAPIVAPSGRLGVAIRDAFRSGTGIPFSTYLGKDGLDRRDDLGGLNMSTVPAAFIECGNMMNPGDAAKMSSGPFRQRMADALAKGFQTFLR